MRLTGERLKLSQGRGRSNPWRILTLLLLIVGGFLLVRAERQGDVQPLFSATPTATRTGASYADEAKVHFFAGDLENSIEAYKHAVRVDPEDAALWAMLARAQTYSSDLLTTLDLRRERLEEARASIDQAIEVNPDNAFAYAIRTLVYDWSASSEVKDTITDGDTVRVSATIGEGGRISANVIELEGAGGDEIPALGVETETNLRFSGLVESTGDELWVISGRTVYLTPLTVIREKNRKDAFLTEAQQAAVRASQLDPENFLASAFRAEVYVDQGDVRQAADYAETAVDLALERGIERQFLMDIYRVYGTVLENQGFYRSAIEAYQEAANITPNFTLLYLRIGNNYRALSDFDTALTYYDKAAKINSQLGIDDPTPYLAIGNTYARQGEFFVAALNIERALDIDPTNPNIYGRLGSVYFRARNYESAIPVLKCAVRGCDKPETGDLLCELKIYLCDPGSEIALEIGEDVVGLPLSDASVEYYYTYGSALTFYAGEQDACERAEEIFLELMAVYGGDPIVSAIVEEGQLVCREALTFPRPPNLSLSTPTPIPSATP
ncbi:MAG: tetratricopeptide repeat protein [Anaerolineales bacterium]|nr:MAG: tetratricopeptide repeat protein [Anaerolineales bacterium]